MALPGLEAYTIHRTTGTGDGPEKPHFKPVLLMWHTLPKDQLFNSEFQFESVFNLEFQLGNT